MDQLHYPWQEWVPNNKMVPIDSSRTCSLPRDALCHAIMSKNPLADAGMLDIFAFYNYKEINFCSL